MFGRSRVRLRDLAGAERRDERRQRLASRCRHTVRVVVTVGSLPVQVLPQMAAGDAVAGAGVGDAAFNLLRG